MTQYSREGQTDTLTLLISSGLPNEDTIYLRVSPAYAKELRGLLEERGLQADTRAEFSDNVVLQVLAVILQGGSVAALASVINTFVTRHKNKEITFGDDHEVKQLRGYSARDAERVTEALIRKQEANRKRQQQWQKLSGSEQWTGVEDADEPSSDAWGTTD